MVARKKSKSEGHSAVEDQKAEAAMPKLDTETSKTVKAKLSRVKLKSKKGFSKIKHVVPKVDPSATVIYLGHLPFGFYEEQIKNFLSQFGEVGRLRVSRSPKTAQPRGFAFIEFFHKEVAEIVVETMNNYLLYGKLLRCHIVEPAKVHAEIWKNANKKFRRLPREKMEAAKFNRVRTDEQVESRQAVLCKREGKLKRKLADLEIEYSFPGYAANTEEMGTTPKKIKKVSEKSAKAKAARASSMISETPAKATKTPAKATKALVDSTETPAKASKTPAKASKTPGKASKTPGKATKTPGKATKTPAKATKTPAKATKALVDSTETPAKASKTPAKVIETPAKASKTPAKASKTPAKASKTPAKATKTPAKVIETPAKASKTPAKTTKTPAKASKTPGKASKTPAKATKTPAKAPKTPAANVSIDDITTPDGSLTKKELLKKGSPVGGRTRQKMIERSKTPKKKSGKGKQ